MADEDLVLRDFGTGPPGAQVPPKLPAEFVAGLDVDPTEATLNSPPDL
jgi:hypothetical protein